MEFVHKVKNLSTRAIEDVEVAIAVPRSDERQAVHSVRFQPPPAKTVMDGWSQETAHFLIPRLPPGEEIQVQWTVLVTLRAIDWLVTERDLGSRREIPNLVLQQYLRDGEGYRLDDLALQRAAGEIRGAAGGMLEELRLIHDFVIDRLEYERDHRWDPAASVLQHRRGSCSEYSSLMIALCRLCSIPARYAGGSWMPLSEDQRPDGAVDRVFHRWVEVFLPRLGWFPVDPTRDDEAGKDGHPYRYFGRLPWYYLAMARGDGDRLECGGMGWEYRSSVKWRGRGQCPDPGIVVDRYATWKVPADPSAGD